MTESTRTQLQSFIHDLSEIPMTDSLVNVPLDFAKCLAFDQIPLSDFEIEPTETLQSLLKQANVLEKESDIQSLCLVHSFVHWEMKGIAVRTPLLLIPVTAKTNKATNRITLQLQEDQSEINPFVKHYFQNWTGEEIPLFNSENTTEWLFNITEKLQGIDSKTHLETAFVLGNFHYHRFHVLRELEGIVRSKTSSNLVEQLLGEADRSPTPLHLSTKTLTSLDTDQIRAIELFNQQNTVVQGPPGTGKSQVITTLIGQTMEAELKTLVVSEKKMALHVLVKKLASVGLDCFTFVVHAQIKSKDLLDQLKSTWHFLETFPVSKKVKISTATFLTDKLQLLLDRLNAKDLLGGISFSEFIQIKLETETNADVFLSDTPSMKEWLIIRPTVIEIEHKLGSLIQLKGYKPLFFQQINGDQILNTVEELFVRIQPLLASNTVESLLELESVLSRCQLIENESFLTCNQLLDHPKEWVRFVKKVNQLRLFISENEELEAEKQLWKVRPTASQLQSLNALAEKKWAKRRTKKAIRFFLKDAEFLDPMIALDRLNKVENYEQERAKREAYFIGLGFEPDIAHLQLAIQFTKQLQSEQDSKLKTVANWEAKKRKAILQNQFEIKELVRLLRVHFQCSPNDSIADYIQKKRGDYQNLLPCYELIQQLPAFVFKLLEHANHWKELQAIVVHSNWKITEARFPQLTQFTGSGLGLLLDEIIQEEAKENAQFAEELKSKIKVRFDQYEQLLRTPSHKLSVSEKEQKAQLKRGKSLLVKEFAKSRSHISIRQLLAGDALPWIQLLLPAWFSTPTQIANHFPLIPELFDAVIFDEASQIQLPNALGALYRSKRALIAGDDQQMAPSQFFGMKIKTHDLLHQATFNFYKTPLKHHYRSSNSQLIAFSNTHFYSNELMVYPAPTGVKSIVEHVVKNGVFELRKNKIEAHEVAVWLETADWTKTLGIVAFSEEQLNEIWENCSVSVRTLITEGMENNRVFFKSLEHVQGDEAAVLVISLGYAPNAEGEFHLRFGPLNQANGHKRLNVLLTRAQEQIHFFTSVREHQFKLSTNEAVNLLRRFLMELEQQNSSSDAIIFPHNIIPHNQEGNQLSLAGVYEQIPQARELITFHQVLTNRGWKIHYT